MDDYVRPCESPVIDVDDSIKKLAWMGFTDEDDVRNALETTNYDINEAISLLMYKYVGELSGGSDANYQSVSEPAAAPEMSEASDRCISATDLPAAVEDLIKGHDLTTEFSSVEFSRLRARVFTNQWDIPCLRNQPLGKCLLGTIHLLRENGIKVLDTDSECREFAFNCLPECVTKLMTSQAVYNWDRDTLEGVHNMLELMVRLICQYFTVFKEALTEESQRSHSVHESSENIGAGSAEYIGAGHSALSRASPSAGHFAMESLRLLTLIFDCEANYHQLCRDRHSNTGTYTDPFNDWSSIAESVNGAASVFAETLPSPRNFYLVNLLNCFGVLGGFKFLRWFGTQRWTSVNMMTSLLAPLAGCADYLTEFTLRREFGVVVLQRVLWRLSNLNEDDFKDRDSRIFDVIGSLRVLVHRLVELNIAYLLAPFLVSHDESGDCHALTVREPDWEAKSLAALAETDVTEPASSTPLTASVAIQEIDRLHCTLLLAALSPPHGAAGASFNGRMLALRNLVEQLEAAKVVSENGGNYQPRNDSMVTTPMRRRPVVHQFSSANLLASENAAFLARRAKRRTIRLDCLMTWLRDREVILKSMHNLDNTAYMTALGQLFRLLGERLTTADLTTVWHRTTNQTGAAVDNILTLLTDVASTRFVQPQLDHLFYLVDASWINLNRQAQAFLSSHKRTEKPKDSDLVESGTVTSLRIGDEPSHVRHARARLLNLVGRIGTTTKEPWKADMCVELLWCIVIGNSAHGIGTQSSDVIRASGTTSRMSTSVPTSANSSTPCAYRHPEPIEAALAQQLVILREFRCSGVDQRLRAMRWLTKAVEHVNQNSLTFFMLAYIKSLVELILKNFVGRAKRDHLNELIRSHDLITKVVSSLLRYEQWAIQTHGDLLSADSHDELGFRHSEVVKRHFELLHFLLKNAELTLNVERAKSLWEIMIGNSRAVAYDREQCFAWFTASMSHLEPEAQTMLFTKLILKSSPTLFRSFSGFECFKAFFEKVNLHEGRMKQVSKLWHVDKPDLIGLDFLWDLYLALPSLDASLDGIHMNTVPVGESAQWEATRKASSMSDPTVLSTSTSRPQSASQPADTSTPAIGCPMVEPNAVKLARQLLLDVHWGQLAPRLRRDPDACYRRFFDACRRRLEANWAAGRGMVPKRGVHSALAETGQLLAALIIGPGPAGRAKHCSRTAARLALRRLLGLVHAYIQTVEDEMFGSRVLHPTWRPHGTTFRGWELRIPLRVETLRPGQAGPTTVRLISPERSISGLFSPFDTFLAPSKKSPEAAQPICLLIHSNEMLGSVRDRSNLVSTALLFANRLTAAGMAGSHGPVSSTSCSSWSASALYLDPLCAPERLTFANQQSTNLDTQTNVQSGNQISTPVESTVSSREIPRRGSSDQCPKRLLETVLNRKPVGELGFQNGRQLTVRLIAALNARTGARGEHLSTALPVGASALNLSICSASPSMISMVNQGNTSEADLVARAAAALHTGAEDSDRLIHSGTLDALFPRLNGSISASINLGVNSSAAPSGVQLARGSSMLSLNSNAASLTSGTTGSPAELAAPQVTSPVTTSSLPSLCLGEDLSVYELLIELAEAELVHTPTFPGTEGKKNKNAVSGIHGAVGVSLSSSFSLIHPIRLLLATLPTCPATVLSRTGNPLQQSLFCSPTTLLKSTPYRTLYKLQMLSASLIPVDSTPWWNVSPGCLLSPPSQLYANAAPAPMPVSFGATNQGQPRVSRSSVVHRMNDFTGSSRIAVESGSSTASSVTPSNDPQWFMSNDSFAFSTSAMMESTSAPSSPVSRRRRNFKLFSNHADTPSHQRTVKSRQSEASSHFKNSMSLVANVPPVEYLEPLVDLLHRQLQESEPEMSHSVSVPLSGPFGNLNQSTLSANIAWWRREVRHLCLQLLAFVLNPHGGHIHCDTSPPGSYRPSLTSNADSSYGLARQYLTPAFGIELLSALLDTAVASAGVSEQIPRHLTGSGPTVPTKQSGLSPIYQPNKDSRAGVAGLIEVITLGGQNMLYQDVEVAVQCIHLLVQCVLAYPTRLLDCFLALDRLEDKLLRLLTYSPSVRIRTETARQLEHLSLLSSRYLRLGETCSRECDCSAHSDFSGVVRCDNIDSPCFTHNHIAYPNLLRFLLKIVFPSRIPVYPPRIDLHSNHITALMAQSSEYFRVRGFLIGQTPESLLESWLQQDHVTLLREELAWFRAAAETESNWVKTKRVIVDYLLAGHLEVARLICAQTVACVMSHSACLLTGSGSAAAGAASLHANLDKTSRGSVSAAPNMSYASWDSRWFYVPVVLLESLSDPNWNESATKDQKSRSTAIDLPLISLPENQGFTISGARSLYVSTQCFLIARDFVHYLITECLFPAASHILQYRTAKSPHVPSATLTASLTSLRSSELMPLRVNNLIKRMDPAKDCPPLSNHVQTPRLIDGFGQLTKRSAYAFILLLVRVDVSSLEHVVDLLILLHHNHDPVQLRSFSAHSSVGPSSAMQTPDNLSSRSSPRASQVLLSEESTGHGRNSQCLPMGFSWDLQPVVTGRNESGFVGLRNGGATCYMNAVLQQIFMQPGLPEALLSIHETDEQLDENNILFQTQKMFGYLLESQLEYYDPSGFWKSFRPWDTSESVNPREQQDAFDFFQALIDQLDEELKKLKREPFFQAIYQGIFLDSKFCDECEHRYDREEVFSAINLAVRVHDLQEALNQFVRGEVLDGDNAYYCERCHVKRRTVKRMSVHTLPPVLCLHLKRFDFDWDRQVPVKFSDHFTFPRQLDMSPYMADSIQKLRPEAFFSPSSSTTSLLQREARFMAPSTGKKKFHLSDNELSEESLRTGTSVDVEPHGLPHVPATPSIHFPDSLSPEGKTQRPAFGLDVTTNMPSTASPMKKAPTPGLLAPTSAATVASTTAMTQHLYRLVGIIVHSGQANSGHYYAFIKDRGRISESSPLKSSSCMARTFRETDHMPSDVVDCQATMHQSSFPVTERDRHHSDANESSPTKGSSASTQCRNGSDAKSDSDGRWYRFNDTSVEPVELDDALLEHECFGGAYKVVSADGRSIERRTRYWSAYMLFYERVDLNHAALRQGLITSRGKTGEESHASRPQPAYDSPVSTVNVNVTPPKTDRFSEFSLSESPFDLSRTSGPSCGIGEYEQNSPPPLFRSDSLWSCHMPKRIASQIWAENWAFLRDRNIFSKDYFDAIRGLCEGILLDSNSLRHEPQRGVIGTRLLSHFIFHTFLCLHPRTKLSIEGCLSDAQSASSSALRDMATQINSEWLSLLLRMAGTSPKACRWLMHFLYTSPTQPCLVYMLLAPRPNIRQQLANTLLAVLRTFYAFRETNILDGTLTGLVNHLLGFLDCGLAAEYATQAGALFSMLRGYVEMCPHASLHLINLKTTKRILNYLMEPQIRDGSYASSCGTTGAFVACAPTWSDRLRAWTPAQQHEMGNLYYLLALLILQTSFDDYCTIRPIGCSPPRPVLLTVPSAAAGSSTKQASWGRLMLRPHKETVTWLGLIATPNRSGRNTVTGGKSISATCGKTLSPSTSSHPFRPGSTEQQRSDCGPIEGTYLVGLFHLCEILLRAYLENAATPNLATLPGTTDFSRNLSQTIGGVPSSVAVSGASRTVSTVSISSTASGAGAGTGSGLNTPGVQTSVKTGEESMTLREVIIQAMLHLTYCSWESSFCFIIALLSRIETRPQSELRHLFDLLNELLCLMDPIQSARIAAVMHGLVIRPTTELDGHRWCPRPNVDPHLWAWNVEELDIALQSATHMEAACPMPATVVAETSEANDAVNGEMEDTADTWPRMPKGLLELITTEAYQDSRRVYQCIKFIVHLSSKTDAVMSYLTGFPERWEPAVKWLENLMESSEEVSAARSSVAGMQTDGSTSRREVQERDSGALYMVLPSGNGDISSSTAGSGRHLINLTDASNESEEDTTGFQRTVSAQTTLREAARILFTMPRVRAEPAGLSALPVDEPGVHREVEGDDEDEYGCGSGRKLDLFYKLPS
ncbi:Ubiquitin carboxyl-terminal hydrolase 24 [Fasciola hepatica]|uniref:Ubiquitin carboxyl-terminal hydrolase 24 n=1 Tax=Fasciola hepatica TaxID=6192 RepID=A0A4E0S3M0_FASHE|nr:Ubiquitin carboxyl-terminal hydrolase 24 [Fasciola hepatica]